MTDAQYAELKVSIASEGFKLPVWTFDGELIDGVHHERACKELGLPLRSEEWDGNGRTADNPRELTKSRAHL
jgi:hypothetical protein